MGRDGPHLQYVVLASTGENRVVFESLLAVEARIRTSGTPESRGRQGTIYGELWARSLTS